MRRRVGRVVWAGLGSVAIVGTLAGCQATPPAPPATTPAARPTPTTPPPVLHDGTFTGDVVSTPRGDVQVQITVTSGRIDDIEVIKYPDEVAMSANVSKRAIPVLVAEGLAAQSADVDTVSGATYTSIGYRDSLQSAIDQAAA